MAMEEELDEFEVLWPDTSVAHAAHEPPAGRASPLVPVLAQVQPYKSSSSSKPCAPQRCSARSRPVDVPNLVAARWHGFNGKDGDDDDDDDEDGGRAIVPPHLLVPGWRRSEAETAWPLRASGPPCKRARDLRHLRNSVLRMTGFIEG